MIRHPVPAIAGRLPLLRREPRCFEAYQLGRVFVLLGVQTDLYRVGACLQARDVRGRNEADQVLCCVRGFVHLETAVVVLREYRRLGERRRP